MAGTEWLPKGVTVMFRIETRDRVKRIRRTMAVGHATSVPPCARGIMPMPAKSSGSPAKTEKSTKE